MCEVTEYENTTFFLKMGLIYCVGTKPLAQFTSIVAQEWSYVKDGLILLIMQGVCCL